MAGECFVWWLCVSKHQLSFQYATGGLVDRLHLGLSAENTCQDRCMSCTRHTMQVHRLLMLQVAREAWAHLKLLFLEWSFLFLILKFAASRSCSQG